MSDDERHWGHRHRSRFDRYGGSMYNNRTRDRARGDQGTLAAELNRIQKWRNRSDGWGSDRPRGGHGRSRNDRSRYDRRSDRYERSGDRYGKSRGDRYDRWEEGRSSTSTGWGGPRLAARLAEIEIDATISPPTTRSDDLYETKKIERPQYDLNFDLDQNIDENFMREFLLKMAAGSVTFQKKFEKHQLKVTFQHSSYFQFARRIHNAISDLGRLDCQKEYFTNANGLRRYIDDVWQDLETEAEIIVESNRGKIQAIRLHLSSSKSEQTEEEREMLQEKMETLERQEDELRQGLANIRHDTLSVKQMSNAEVIAEMASIEKKVVREFNMFETALPIYAKRSRILKTIRESQVSIVVGETGSGKSTALPEFLHLAAYDKHGAIATTQPRKVAAIAHANQVAKVMGSKVGETVGFRVGTSKNMTDETPILFTTDDVLLDDYLKDPLLGRYSCIIIDEAHERNINTDLLLAMLKKCLEVRSDLRVIITSATIDSSIFFRYFKNCQTVRVSGRQFPVNVEHASTGTEIDLKGYLKKAVDKTTQILRNTSKGDVLVFLPCSQDTEQACQLLTDEGSSQAEWFAFHSDLQPIQQMKVLQASSKRKVIFATEIAETSLTFDNVRFVVDTGLTNSSDYDPDRDMTSLVIKVISQSAAVQRKGRVGRTSQGECYRLYTKEDYENMETSSIPEILRKNLAQPLLRIMNLGVNSPSKFDFLESPSKMALKKGMERLHQLEAYDQCGLTYIGVNLASLSIEPILGKLILLGLDENIGYDALITAAICTTGVNLFLRAGNEDEKDLADRKKMKLCHESGDLVTSLEVYRKWNAVPEADKEAWCLSNCINSAALESTKETTEELYQVLTNNLKIEMRAEFELMEEVAEILPKIILSCYPGNICLYSGYHKSGYFPWRIDEQVYIDPSSSLALTGSTPKWVVYDQLVHSHMSYMKNVTLLKDEWVREYMKMNFVMADSVDRLEARLMLPVLVGKLGKVGMDKLAGTDGKSLKKLEEDIQARIGDHASIELNKGGGKIEVVCLERYYDDVKKFVTPFIDQARGEFVKEVTETAITKNGHGSLVIGQGGAVTSLLLPNEFKDVSLTGSLIELVESDVEDLLSRFGAIEKICLKDTTGLEDHRLVERAIVTFVDPVAAQEASTSTERLIIKDKEFHIQAIKPDLKKHSQPDKHRKPVVAPNHGLLPPSEGEDDYRVRVFWEPSALSGKVFIKVNDFSHNRPRPKEINIDGKYYRVEYGKGDVNEFSLHWVDSHLQEGYVRRCVEEAFKKEGFEDFTIKIPRARTNTGIHIVEQGLFRHDLLALLRTKTQCSIDIGVQPSKGKAVVANVTFGDPTEGFAVVNEIHDKPFKGYYMEITSILKEKVVFPRDMVNCIKRSVDHVLSKVRASCKRLDNGDLMVEVVEENQHYLKEKIGKFKKILEGSHFGVTRKSLAYFTSRLGRVYLKDLMKKTRTLIRVVPGDSSLHIYGDNANEARQQLLERTTNLEYHEIHLRGDKKPSGLMKKLVQVYGIDLRELERDSEAESVFLISRSHVLAVVGKQASADKLEEIIEKFCSNLEADSTEGDEGEENLCPVCFCPVSPSFYVLESCGHSYCKECISDLLKNAIFFKEYPIECATEKCNHPLCHSDFTNLLSTEEMISSTRAALDCYMGKHTNLKHCSTPECTGLYRVTSRAIDFTCTECAVSFCQKCGDNAHKNVSCDIDSSVRQWIKQDPKKRSVCPKCDKPIEKDGGCQHMSCPCGAHICWQCKKVFKNSTACYRHMQDEFHF